MQRMYRIYNIKKQSMTNGYWHRYRKPKKSIKSLQKIMCYCLVYVCKYYI